MKFCVDPTFSKRKKKMKVKYFMIFMCYDIVDIYTAESTTAKKARQQKHEKN